MTTLIILFAIILTLMITLVLKILNNLDESSETYDKTVLYLVILMLMAEVMTLSLFTSLMN